MEKNLEVIRLWALKFSLRQISSAVSLHRETIKKIIGAATSIDSGMTDSPSKEFADRVRALRDKQSKRGNSKKYPDLDWVAVNYELRKKGATLRVLHGEYIANNPKGMSYSAYCDRYRKFAKSHGVVMAQNFSPGMLVQVDYAGDRFPLFENGVEYAKAEIFVGILGYSGLIFAYASKSQTIPDWIAAHDAMFRFFGGAPKIIVCDNLKSAVKTRQHKIAVISAHYKNFADHYGSLVVPARPKKPRDKALVESAVRLITRSFIYPLSKLNVTSLGELNLMILEHVQKINKKNYQGKTWSRISLFEQSERSELIALPNNDYVVPEISRCRVNSSYHIEVDGNKYSVPNACVNKYLDIKAFPSELIFELAGVEVARHQRCPGFREIITNPEHMTESHLKQKMSSENRLNELRQKIGQNAFDFVTKNKTLVYHEQHLHIARNLVCLAQTYAPEIIENACAYCLNVGQYDIEFMTEIAKNGVPEVKIVSDPTKNPIHENIRGKEYYSALGESE